MPDLVTSFLPGVADPETWVALLSLCAMEIVLGIDNIVFISILTGALPAAERPRAARLGIAGALVLRIALLLTISAIMQLTEPLFEVLGHAFSGKHLILLAGGLFLVGKATVELHRRVEGHDEQVHARAGATFAGVIAQILLLDMVFSLDSIITAVGMVEPEQIWVMVTAVLVSVVVMLAGVRPITAFVERHPTVKVLALAFLLLIGVMLVAEGIGQHIPKGYIYFAIAFSLGVEVVNQRVRARSAASRASP